MTALPASRPQSRSQITQDLKWGRRHQSLGVVTSNIHLLQLKEDLKVSLPKKTMLSVRTVSLPPTTHREGGFIGPPLSIISSSHRFRSKEDRPLNREPCITIQLSPLRKTPKQMWQSLWIATISLTSHMGWHLRCSRDQPQCFLTTTTTQIIIISSPILQELDLNHLVRKEDPWGL